ncbi:DnaJ domain-containing protein [Gongronella butleri]|nr:DnaJ domain-containing protein [Gongronella butleri]
MGYPDYYKVLDVSEHATLEEIKLAYKRQALVHHPDRLDSGASAAERAEATKRFQLIADAYYVLSDENRRKEYDHVRDRHGDPAKARPQATETEAHNVFGNVFEELLQPEVERPGHLWRILGGGSGAVLGFIVGNLGGAAVVSFGKKDASNGLFIHFLIAFLPPGRRHGQHAGPHPRQQRQDLCHGRRMTSWRA